MSAVVADFGELGALLDFTVAALPRTLREVREQRGLTFREAAAQAGVSERAWRLYEQGQRPNVACLIALLAWLDKA